MPYLWNNANKKVPSFSNYGFGLIPTLASGIFYSYIHPRVRVEGWQVE